MELKSKGKMTLKPVTGKISKIILYHNQFALLRGMQLFAVDGRLIYESSNKWGR